jgi:hypothetical protein
VTSNLSPRYHLLSFLYCFFLYIVFLYRLIHILCIRVGGCRNTDIRVYKKCGSWVRLDWQEKDNLNGTFWIWIFTLILKLYPRPPRVSDTSSTLTRLEYRSLPITALEVCPLDHCFLGDLSGVIMCIRLGIRSVWFGWCFFVCVGVLRDWNLKLEDVKASHTLGRTGEHFWGFDFVYYEGIKRELNRILIWVSM